MFSDTKISKGGLIGAASGLLVSIFAHKNTDTTGKKVLKSGGFSLIGYLLGAFVEKKIKK